ncbi:2-dehydro-3-deoxygluconokinase [Roseivirga pacifica]|uniref:2-dehydro-3-deoxygluconokinase n=1 Tax=Roseivirga pacifica TaxID=1267423 RepID=A0A1I0MA95_9BACT|nr:sugar kinase [Roseivirga pacifica]RKQ50202.1 2-dehydro-3-deoxygluconokinase [Roseivirga pacifica]SEV85028.1 2-dehydro-3-deoxygluconokinase [Roseivirga pacifica]
MKILSIGELLMRLTVPDNLRFTQANEFRLNIGGSEANVAMILAQLGWDASVLSALPNNDLGDRVLQELHRFKVDTAHIARIGERVGLYFLEEGSSIRSSRIIYDRGHASINDLTPEHIDWDAVFEGVTHLHWSGITPALSLNAAMVCQEAVDRAYDLGVSISCDLHFRKNLWAYGKKPIEVISPLLEKSATVLGDPSTIQSLTGLEMESKKITAIESVDQLLPDYRKLMDRFPSIKGVSMLLRTIQSASHHNLKAVLVTDNEAFEAPTIKIDNIKDRIGGGDAYMAGLLYGLNHYKDKQDGLKFALAISALKHTISGDYFTGKVEEVEQIMNATQLGKIIR